jgi:hypothetical protein
MGQNGQEKQVEQMWHAQARKKHKRPIDFFFLSFYFISVGG